MVKPYLRFKNGTLFCREYKYNKYRKRGEKEEEQETEKKFQSVWC